MIEGDQEQRGSLKIRGLLYGESSEGVKSWDFLE